MSRYLPPHRREQQDEQSATGTDQRRGATQQRKVPEDEPLQREMWTALNRTLTGIINKVSGSNLEAVVVELFRENIVCGRGLLVQSLIRTQNADPELTNVFAAVVSRINKDLPEIGLLLLKRLVSLRNRLHLRKEWLRLTSVTKFISWLYLFNIVEVDLIYQLILSHLDSPTRSDDDIQLATAIFSDTFRMMSARTPADFHEHVLTPLRDMLAMDDPDNPAMALSERAQALLESSLKMVQQWERVKHDVEVIPPNLILVDPEEQNCHTIDLTERCDTEEALNRFRYDPDYDSHEEEYEKIRCALLGDNWELELLQQVAAAEEAEDDMDNETTAAGDDDGEMHNGGANKGGDADDVWDGNKPLDASERQIRKQVYVAIRSSVRADEAVHKILKDLVPQSERVVCFMVIECCCEEKTYSKMYAMAAERLCKSNARFQTFFVEAFRQRYKHAEDLEVRQIEYASRIFGHMLRTDSLLWSQCLSVLDIVHNNTSQRLMIQFLLQEVVEGMGMRSVLERFAADKELQSCTQNLFPTLDTVSAPALETAVKLFEEMKVGELANSMRHELDEHRRAVKRPREEN